MSLVCVFATAAACTDDTTRRSGDSALTDSPLPSIPARETTAIVPQPLPEVAARRMRWDVPAVAAALEAAGLVRRGAAEPVTESFLSAPGSRIRFSHHEGGKAEIQAFIYGDAGAVARDLEGLDTVRVAPRSRNIEWRVPARLITDNNLILILLTENSRIREIVRQAILRP